MPTGMARALQIGRADEVLGMIQALRPIVAKAVTHLVWQEKLVTKNGGLKDT